MEISDLKSRAIRASIANALIGFRNGSAHLSSSLSCVEALTACLDFKRDNPGTELILSKGHAAAGLYAAMSQTGFLGLNELVTFGKEESELGIHVSRNENIPLATGSLGHGLSFAVGIALANSKKNLDLRTIVIIGDGESNEGSVWEAAAVAGRLNLGNLILLVDHNLVQAVGTYEEVSGSQNLERKFMAFGWETSRVSGHDPDAILSRIKEKSEKPMALILDSQMNPTLGFMQESVLWHYKNPSEDDMKMMIQILNAKSLASDILELFKCEEL